MGRGGKEAVSNRVRQEHKYLAIKELHEEEQYTIAELCNFADIARSSYYKWINRPESETDRRNTLILEEMIRLYTEVHGIYGYRRMTMNINRIMSQQYNHKRIYRLMKSVNIKSVIRKKRKNYIPSTPQITAENILNRNFHADKPNQKWLTDVTEFKLTNGLKAYLSAILDLGDRRIVSYVLGRSNNNQLVFETFDLAVAANPDAKPLFHSDRGFQYTNRQFKNKIDSVCGTQSMSRVSRCIDNGPMEGFWGIIKSEMYYLQKFHTYEELELAIDQYIDFYNTRRLQKKLKGLTPIEYRNQTLAA
ncbi:IS3 family transposase [Dehalobacter restrictus]|uniref:IS3 family transposase n=1 Tax=Dehalobacter restrictus TaxID=55583 RepID=UPI002A167E7E|nr:IS3 family transposase [Dehalobacter sp.]